MAIKVLLIGASATALSDVKTILQEKGYTVQHLTDSRDALGLYYTFKPNLVIVDNQVAGVSGVDVCRLIKSHGNGNNVILMLLTHLPGDPRLVSELAQRVQADELIGKPYSADTIIAKVEQWFESDSRPDPIFARDIAGDMAQEKKERVMPVEGKLADFPFVKLLHLVFRHRFNGELLLNDKRKRLRVVFRSGDPIAVESNYVREDALGQMLLEEKKLTETQLAEAEKRREMRNIRLGEALIELEYLTHQELEEELQRQKYNKLLGVFDLRWRSGEFAVRPGLFKYNMPDMPIISTVRLLQDGIASTFDQERLEKYFHAKDRINRTLHTTTDLDLVYGNLRLDDNLRRVVNFIRQGRKINELEVLVNVERLWLLKFIYTLVVLGAVKFAKISDQLPAISEYQEPDEARQVAAKASSGRDSYAEYNRNLYLGKQFFIKGDYEKAMPFLRIALSHNANCPECLAMIGWCYYNLRERSDRYATEESKEYLRKAIESAPSFAKAYLFMAKILKNENNETMAERYARKAYHFDPGDPEIAREYDLAKARRRNTLNT